METGVIILVVYLATVFLVASALFAAREIKGYDYTSLEILIFSGSWPAYLVVGLIFILVTQNHRNKR